MAIRVLIIAACLTLSASATQAQGRGADQIDMRTATADQKREWLSARFAERTTDRRVLDEANAKLDRLPPRQLDQLIAAHYRQLAAAQRNLQQALIARERLRRQLNGGNGGNAAGFRPVITRLPTGTSLNVGAVVSPDRRYVRINAQPFFSNVPYYDTFNFATGETRRYPVNPPRRATSSSSRQDQSWYDGLRTRTDPRPVSRN
jgi:hypothetical protein